MKNKEEELNALEHEIKNCQKCRLCKTATNAVPGSGNPDSKIIFIGEAPGFHEDQQGLPFVGRAGKLLDFLLKQIDLDRNDVWIGNIVKHRPPDNRDPLPDEIEACKPYLTRQIEIIQPTIVVTLGRYSMNYFLPFAKISESHGVAIPKDGMIIYPVYHPAAALRNPKMKIALMKDFLQIPDIIKKIEIESLNINKNVEKDFNGKSDSTQEKLF